MSSTQPQTLFQPAFNHQSPNQKGSNEFIRPISDDIKTVDTTYLYTPTQYLISNFLTTKKTIEDDLIQTLKGITEMRSKPETSVNQLRDQLNSKKKQLQGIKRKLNKSCEQQIQVYDIMRKRIHRHQPQHKINSKLSNSKHYQDKPNLSKESFQTKKSQKMFDLNFNKQITYFMVGQSVRLQQKIIAQQQQSKKNAEKSAKIQGQYQKSMNQLNLLNQPQIQEELQQKSFFSQIPMQGPDFNMVDDLLDLQRFFQSEHFEMDYFNTLRGLGKNLRDMEKKVFPDPKTQKSTQAQLWITQNDLFKETQFVQKLDQNYKLRESSEMQLQEPPNTQTQKNHQTHKDLYANCLFEGQLQLQCVLYRKKQTISNDILSNSLDSVNMFLYENSHMIKKYDSDLEFWVIICKAIDFIKTKDQSKEMEAIQIMRNKTLKMKGDIQNWHRQQLQKVTSMLLLENFFIQTKLYLQKTEEAFRQVFQKIYRLPDFSRFLHSLYTGALILKTPTCVEKDKQNPLICPLCNPLAEKVFTSIPLLTRNQSNLICRIDGSLMDHENYPMMLPSHQIYSMKGLQSTKKMIKHTSGKHIEQYYCKFTSTWYYKEQAKKVYLA